MSIDPPAKKSLGQHWLRDEKTLDEIVSYAELTQDDLVLEIGPGLGDLTRILCVQADQVIAVELDNNLASTLMGRVGASNLSVVTESILTYDLTNLRPHYKIVANIPYYLTSNLIRVLSESTNPPDRVVLLIQKEVAERLAARPGDLSILGVTAQFFWEVGLKNVVEANMFTPPPKVDSQVVVLDYRSKPLFNDVDSVRFFRLVKLGFSAKRKTLLNSLAAGLRIDKQATSELIVEAGLDPNNRAQKLSLEDWYELYKVSTDKNLV